MSRTSAKVHTAATPRSARAALVSTPTSRPFATGERTTRIVSWRGKPMSAAYWPRPVTSGRSSRRLTERPTKPIALRSRRSGAQRGADALGRRRKLVDRHAERAERIIHRVDDGGRRADRAAFAEALRLGHRG